MASIVSLIQASNQSLSASVSGAGVSKADTTNEAAQSPNRELGAVSVMSADSRMRLPRSIDSYLKLPLRAQFLLALRERIVFQHVVDSIVWDARAVDASPFYKTVIDPGLTGSTKRYGDFAQSLFEQVRYSSEKWATWRTKPCQYAKAGEKCPKFSCSFIHPWQLGRDVKKVTDPRSNAVSWVCHRYFTLNEEMQEVTDLPRGVEPCFRLKPPSEHAAISFDPDAFPNVPLPKHHQMPALKRQEATPASAPKRDHDHGSQRADHSPAASPSPTPAPQQPTPAPGIQYAVPSGQQSQQLHYVQSNGYYYPPNVGYAPQPVYYYHQPAPAPAPAPAYPYGYGALPAHGAGFPGVPQQYVQYPQFQYAPGYAPGPLLIVASPAQPQAAHPISGQSINLETRQ